MLAGFWLQTLSDADERAAYDSMVGLCADAINPFKDQAQEADHVGFVGPFSPLSSLII